MDTVTVSSKYQIVIPKNIRKKLNIKAGQKFNVIPIGRHIELIPFVPVEKMKGFVKGINTDIPREKDRV